MSSLMHWCTITVGLSIILIWLHGDQSTARRWKATLPELLAAAIPSMRWSVVV